MRPLAEAQRDVLAAVPPLPVIEIPLHEALGWAWRVRFWRLMTYRPSPTRPWTGTRCRARMWARPR